jgi:hypothetical protein
MTNYWFEVDFNGGGSAQEYYLPDGDFAVGDDRFQGHSEIRAFYTWRQRRGIRPRVISSITTSHAGGLRT